MNATGAPIERLLSDGATLLIQPYSTTYAVAVRELFVTVNRLMAPPELRAPFEAYIERALSDEIERIPAYYAERAGSFWIATLSGELVDMFGLETVAAGTLKLRRMYVAPAARRRGIAATLLEFAEHRSRLAGADWLVLSTSQLQQEALALYRRSGYELEREEQAAGGDSEQQDHRRRHSPLPLQEAARHPTRMRIMSPSVFARCRQGAGEHLLIQLRIRAPVQRDSICPSKIPLKRRCQIRRIYFDELSAHRRGADCRERNRG